MAKITNWPDHTPGNWFVSMSHEGRHSLWEALDDNDRRWINDKGAETRTLYDKGGWHSQARFVNITAEDAAACLMVATLNPAAWHTYAKRFFT